MAQFRVIVKTWGVRRVYGRTFDSRSDAFRTVALALGYGYRDLLAPSEGMKACIDVQPWPQV